MKRLMPLGLFVAGALLPGTTPAQALSGFTAGDLVVSVEGAGVYGGTASPYADNQAAPLSLFEYLQAGTSSASYVGAEVLPQSTVGAQYAVSAEYGSSSEATLQLSGNGQYLTIAGYGVNAAAFNANPSNYSADGNPALGQSGSLTGQSYTAVPRVVAEIAADGSVDSSTALYNVFDTNNPRSVYSVDGQTFYVSGQGASGDTTGGVFYATKGATSATPITGLDTSSNKASQDTREVQVYDNQLYVSTDSKGGKNAARDFVGTLGSSGALPTSVANANDGPAMLPGYGNSGGTGKVTITSATTNGVNMAGQQINLSPENYFFANASTLYVADSGDSKNDSATSSVGDGGLQKWTFANGVWTLDYTLAAGLDLVANSSAVGSSGLYGLTGKVVGDVVELYATNFTLTDTGQTYLYGVTDLLAATTAQAGEQFTTLAAAPVDSNFKGVAFAPTSAAPEPSTWALMLTGVGLVGGVLRQRRRRDGSPVGV